MSIVLDHNTITIGGSAEIDWVDFGLKDGDHINNGTTSGEVTGKVERVVVHYISGSGPPKTFKAALKYTFPKGANLKTDGGGPTQRELSATDNNGDIVIWGLVGIDQE